VAGRNDPRNSNESKIAKKRMEKGLTQGQLARMVGTKQQLISSYERGIVVPTVIRYHELAEVFGCDWKELVD